MATIVKIGLLCSLKLGRTNVGAFIGGPVATQTSILKFCPKEKEQTLTKKLYLANLNNKN